jgi:glycerophosphoryl diester phosphodiesterase
MSIWGRMKESTSLMTIERRSFLQFCGAGIGIFAAKNLSSGQRPAKSNAAARKILVAHRGASAYAPEHTLESYQLALKQHADYVEQDLQITRDGILVCLHDLTLERTTNVKEIFPTRYREEQVNGLPARRWYVSDFTLQELKQLDAGSWFDMKFKGARVPTFQEAIDLVRGKGGLYPETKAPEVYGARGFDMERLVIDLLKKNRLISGNAARHTPVIIQSFSPESLRKLFATLERKLPLVLLVGVEAPGNWLTEAGLTAAKQFATGIGPAKALVDKSVVAQAHALGLSVTPYTFRSSNTGRFKTVREEMNYYLYELGVDAVFTDNPDMFPRVAIHT